MSVAGMLQLMASWTLAVCRVCVPAQGMVSGWAVTACWRLAPRFCRELRSLVVHLSV
jgi:hypothetical protein